MTPERRKKIENIFHAGLEVEPSDRAKFLDQACVGDEAVRLEVESLLAHDVESFLGKPLAGEGIRRIAESHDDSLIAQTIDHYFVLEWLGAGGMGEVYLAEDLSLGRKVALKLLPEFFTRNADQVRRFHQEARAASSLNHPNIITIHELGQTDSLHFISMEFIEGETLRQQMKGRPMPVREVLNVAIQVASGLSAAHHAGIIHRDIKPENIMPGNDGYLKILDFGIAKFREQQALLSDVQSETASLGNTEASAVEGTLSYMSPEQARGEPLDARTDIFSLGIVLYEMAAGRRPFEGETQGETLHAILSDEAQSIRTFRQHVPPDLERIINKALKKNRDDRYQSAKEMLSDLREFNRATGRMLDATQRANRMLRQYLSIYAVDKGALIPITKQWFIRRHSDLERGERGRELLKKSLRRGLLKAGTLTLLLVAVMTVGAAALSVTDEWEGLKFSDGHTRAARQTAFSPNGMRLVTVGEDAKVIVWDIKKRERIATFDDHKGIVTTVAYSPDGKWFVTGSADRSVIVWDAARLEKAAALNEHQSIVTAVAFSRDGKLMASTSDEPDGRTILWDVGSWNKVRELPFGLNYGILLFSPDGRYLLSNAKHKHRWNVATGQQASNDLMQGGNWIALSPTSQLLVGVGSNGQVGFSDLAHRKVTTFSPHRDHCRAAAFSPEGSLLATAADDIVLWDARAQKILTRFSYPSIVWHVAFSPDGQWLVSTHGDGAILLWDVANRKLVANFNEHSQPVRGVAFSPDGKQIASASEDDSVIIWDAERSTKNAVLLGHRLGVQKVAFSKDGTWAASCELDHAVFLWDLEKRERKLAIETTTGGNYNVDISMDGRWVASTWGVYDSADGHLIVDFNKLGKGHMYGVAFSDDGGSLACVTPERFLYLFDTETWQLRDELEVPEATFISVSFSPDNKHLVTGDDEGSVRLWQAEPLRQIGVIGHHASRIKSVAFSPDGREVASAGDDQAIKLWDVNRRRLITNIGTHTSSVLSVAFSPDGKRLVSGEHDHSVRLWTRHRTLWGYKLSGARGAEAWEFFIRAIPQRTE